MKINVFEKLSLQQKILSMVIGASTIIFVFTVGNIALKSRKDSINNAIKHINVVADYHVSEIKGSLEKDLFIVRALSNTIPLQKLVPENKWKEIFAKLYEETLIKNPEFLSVWDSWELNYIDPTYKKDYGRYRCYYWREKGQIKNGNEIASISGDPVDYARIKKNKSESLEDPYFFSFPNDSKNQFLITSIIVPNLVDGRFVGVLGIDIELSRYYNDIRLIKPYENSYAFLLSNNVKYVAHPDKEKIGQNALEDYESIFTKNDVTDKISSGESTFFTAIDVNGVNSYFSVKPIIVGKNKTPWSLVIVVPKTEVVRSSVFAFWESIIIGLIGITILLVITYIFSNKFIISPITRIVNTLQRISFGHADLGMIHSDDQKDEMGKMFSYLNINIKGLSQKTDFAERIGAGDLNVNLDLLSEEDTLGKSLINMRESLKAAKIEEEKRKVEDEKRRWTNEGLAKFSDILRQNNDKLELLAADIIKNLVHYLGANQGGVFIYNDDNLGDVHFELLSAFAFNRHKYLKKQILPGEGLVGTCALEKQTIYLTEIPENYIQVTSGLGEARPRCLLIVPLLIEEKVLGVLEIASFNEIEEFKIEFVEKLAQSIASTLISARTNIRTTLLLSRSQQQAEEMSAQEEEMRQNMEELQATQEESARKEVEMTSIFNALRSSLFIAELDLEGKIIEINSHFADVFSQPQGNLIGKNIRDLAVSGGVSNDEYNQIWRTLQSKQIANTITRLLINDHEIWLNQTFAPIFNNDGFINKILNIAIDITETKRNEAAIKTEREKLKFEEILFSSLMNVLPDRITFKDKNSVYIRVNKAKANALKLNDPSEVIGKTDFDYFEKEHAQQSFLAEKELFVKNQNIIEQERKISLNDGTESWIINNRIILKNEQNEVFGGLVITQDITNLKMLSFELNNVKTLLKSLSEKISLIVYEIDKDGIILNIFGKGLEFIQKETSDLIGNHFESAFPEAPNLFKKSKGNLVHFTTDGLSHNKPVKIEHVLFVNEELSCGFFGYGIDTKIK